MTDLPPNLANTAASAIVRHAEDQKKIEEIAERKAEDDKRRRDEAMRDAAAQRRIPGTSGR